MSDDDVVELNHPENDSLNISMEEHETLETQNVSSRPDILNERGSRRSRSVSRNPTETITTEQQIKQIDLEMKNKLQQLHDLMTKE